MVDVSKESGHCGCGWSLRTERKQPL